MILLRWFVDIRLLHVIVARNHHSRASSYVYSHSDRVSDNMLCRNGHQCDYVSAALVGTISLDASLGNAKGRDTSHGKRLDIGPSICEAEAHLVGAVQREPVENATDHGKSRR